MAVVGVVVVAEEATVVVVFTTEADLGVVAAVDSRGVRIERTSLLLYCNCREDRTTHTLSYCCTLELLGDSLVCMCHLLASTVVVPVIHNIACGAQYAAVSVMVC